MAAQQDSRNSNIDSLLRKLKYGYFLLFLGGGYLSSTFCESNLFGLGMLAPYMEGHNPSRALRAANLSYHGCAVWTVSVHSLMLTVVLFRCYFCP
jgi:hypothetical protein